jgi:hypothetical protein
LPSDIDGADARSGQLVYQALARILSDNRVAAELGGLASVFHAVVAAGALSVRITSVISHWPSRCRRSALSVPWGAKGSMTIIGVSPLVRGWR